MIFFTRGTANERVHQSRFQDSFAVVPRIIKHMHREEAKIKSR